MLSWLKTCKNHQKRDDSVQAPGIYNIECAWTLLYAFCSTPCFAMHSSRAISSTYRFCPSCWFSSMIFWSTRQPGGHLYTKTVSRSFGQMAWKIWVWTWKRWVCTWKTQACTVRENALCTRKRVFAYVSEWCTPFGVRMVSQDFPDGLAFTDPLGVHS